MNSLFTTLDWAVFAVYFAVIAYTAGTLAVSKSPQLRITFSVATLCRCG